MGKRSFIPIINWLPRYKPEMFGSDLAAGITVAVMLIPQGMAYAMLAGLPPIYGLYAATIPLFVYAMFGTSPQLAVGPVAMDSLLVAIGVSELAQSGTEAYIELAIILAAMVGLFQLILGLFRMGFLVNFLSRPVISGFTSAAAIIIGLSQLKYLLGVNMERSNRLHEILMEAAQTLGNIDPVTLMMGVSAIAVILLLKKYGKRIPGALVVVVLGIFAVYFGNLEPQGVAIVGEVPAGFPSFQLPEVSLQRLQDLLPTALTIALIGFMESIAVAKAMQARRKDHVVDANRELTALGLANLFGSFFRSYPVTGGFSRTAVNYEAGAKSQLAAIISGAFILLTLLFLTPLFYYLPQTVLASIIMAAVYGLIDFAEMKRLWKSDKRDLSMLLITFLSTLFIGIQQGIAIGVVLSLIMVIYRSSYPHYAVLGKIPGTDSFRNINRFDEAIEVSGILVIRFDAQLFFGNMQMFRDAIYREIQKREGLKLVIINAEAINTLDSSGARLLSDLRVELNEQDISLIFAGVKGPVRDTMVKQGLFEEFGDDAFFDNMHEAMESYDGKKVTGQKQVRFQSTYK